MVDVSRWTVRLTGKPFFLFAVIIGATLAAPRSTAAAIYQWNVDANGNWNVAGNWMPIGPPGPLNYPNVAGDIAVFPSTATTAARIITIPTGVTITLGDLQISDDHNITITDAGTGRLVMAASSGVDVDIVKTDVGIATISAPVELQGDLTVIASGGSLTFADAVSESGGARAFVKQGTGTVRFNSGVNNTYTGVTTVETGVLELQHFNVTEAINGAFVIGDGAGAPGSAEARWINVNQVDNASAVTVRSDGLLNMNSVGENIGALTVTGGLVQTGAGAAGRLTMTSLNMTGGTLTTGVAGSQFVLEGGLTATSTASQTPSIGGGGALNIASSSSATRTFTINDGPQAIDLQIDVSISQGTGVGSLNKVGTGVLRVAGNVSSSYSGTTTVGDGRLELAHTGATLAVIGPLTVGDGTGAAGSAEVRQISNNNIANSVDVTVLADGLLDMNNLIDTVGVLTVTNGTASLGAGATGHLTMNGLVMTGGTLQTGTAGSSFLLTSGVTATSSTGPATIAGAGALSLNGATRLFTVVNGPSAIDMRIDALVIGTGSEGLTKNGDGVMVLTANNTFTGNASVSSGTLLINGSQPQTTVAVADASATFGGTGTVGPVNVGAGAVAPGNSPGILNTGSVVIGAGFPLEIELNGTTAGSGYDQLNVTGNVFIGLAALEVTLGFTPPAGAQFTIVNNDGTDTIDSGFAGLPEGALFTIGGTQFQITYAGGTGNDIVLTATGALSYYLAEGATGSFFDDDVLIANANTSEAPVTLTFLMEGGATVVDHRTVPAQSRITVHVDTIPGLEATAASVQVTSDNGLPLIVERSMFWDTSYYGGHTANAVSDPRPSWVFAEGSQGFFDTYVLVANANASPTTVTMTFLREADTPVVRTFPMNGFSRLTVYAGDVAELVGRSFGVVVESILPVTAERSMYFASVPGKFWAGGHNNMGIAAPSTSWFHAEGATGGFFNTFILLSNPQTTPANVTLRFLLDTGQEITENKVLGAKERLTINPAAEGIPQLTDAAMSTVVQSDVPIVSERSMYWPGDATPFGEGHNSAGVVATGTKWGLAEGRVGGPLNFLTYILLANPGTTTAEVTITYLREGAGPVVKTYTVPPTSRFNVDVRSVVPEIADNSSFGAKIEVTNSVPIAVERSLYWNANGVFWAGGTNALATLIP